MKDLKTLITLAERIAKEKKDGDVAIFKIKNEWAIFLGVPDLDWCGRDLLWELEFFPTIDEALSSFIVDN